MSLRVRLTLFYSSILGVVLLLFGLAVYGTVSVVLIRQVDLMLERAVYELIQVAQVDSDRLFGLFPEQYINPSVVIQVWDPKGGLIGTSQSFNPDSTIFFPLDQKQLNTPDPVFSDLQVGETHLRVFSVPLVTDEGPLGTMQAAADLETVDTARRELVQLLFGLGGVALITAALAGGVSTRTALSPLATATETAMHITRADDLSRRIPLKGPEENEVGRLIQAFNETLSRLERLFDSQRRFITDVGHELRTPLTVIKGNVDLLRRMPTPDKDSLKVIEAEIDRLTRLVEDLLLLAYAESGRLPLDRSLVELDTILLEVYQQAYVLALGKLELHIAEIDQVLVCGDRDRLKQVILNLLANAINYTPQGGQIIVSLGKSDKYAYLSVKDDGPGIPEKDLPHIFERFYRGEKSRSRSQDGKGFGLGLSIAHWIVESHEGRIEVDTKEGKGTTFNIWLPLAEEDCREMPIAIPQDAAQPEHTG